MGTKIALFDMDGTIADYDGQIREDMHSLGHELPEYYHDLDLSPEIENDMKMIKNQRGWWAELPEIESGMNLMRLCKDMGFRIGILTQGPKRAKDAWGEKLEWCESHVEPIESDPFVVVTRNAKGLVYGRVFADDYVPYMKDWLEFRPRGLGLMPINVGNRDFRHPQVVRYTMDENWRSDELVEKLERAFSREDGVM